MKRSDIIDKNGKNEEIFIILPFLSAIAHIIHLYAPNLILQKLFWCNFGKIQILFGIKWKDIWKNDKFFRGVANIPNHLECFMEDTIYAIAFHIFQ